MTHYEYTTREVTSREDRSSISSMLNKMDEKNWELVNSTYTINTFIFIFRREKRDFLDVLRNAKQVSDIFGIALPNELLIRICGTRYFESLDELEIKKEDMVSLWYSKEVLHIKARFKSDAEKISLEISGIERRVLAVIEEYLEGYIPYEVVE